MGEIVESIEVEGVGRDVDAALTDYHAALRELDELRARAENGGEQEIQHYIIRMKEVKRKAAEAAKNLTYMRYGVRFWDPDNNLDDCLRRIIEAYAPECECTD